MEFGKVSIIVPVYEAETYLRNCIDSILAQTYHDIEVILVDDGSRDTSGIICDEYAQQDARVIVIHKENGGVSSARNIGLNVAKGEYIGFVDSDDTIEMDIYELLLKSLVGNNADMATCGYKCIYDIGTQEIKVENSIYQVKEFCKLVLSDFRMYRIMRGPCNRILRRDLLREDNLNIYGLQFAEEISYGEDTLFVSDVLLKCNTITFVDACLYNYYIRENVNSICANVSDDKNYQDTMTVNNRLCESFKKILPEEKGKIDKVFELQNLLAKRDGKIAAALRSIDTIHSVYRLTFKEFLQIIKLSDSRIITINTILIYFAPKWLYRMICKIVRRKK
jgi:glycosyltransferase involved in cell wall biosynthesis